MRRTAGAESDTAALDSKNDIRLKKRPVKWKLFSRIHDKEVRKNLTRDDCRAKEKREMSISNTECLNQKIKILDAMTADTLKPPILPMERFHQETEFLHKWCISDRAEFVSVGFDWHIAEDLPVRIGASRQAQKEWMESRFVDGNTVREWTQMAKIASDFRDRILSALFYAFRHVERRLPMIREIAKGDEDVRILTDLERLVALARAYPEPLFTVRFNFQYLDDAEFLAEKMVGLLSFASKDSLLEGQKKRLRDAAYTHLKEASDEIRACGLYVFRRNAERVRGYGASTFGIRDDRIGIEDRGDRYRIDSSAMFS